MHFGYSSWLAHLTTFDSYPTSKHKITNLEQKVEPKVLHKLYKHIWLCLISPFFPKRHVNITKETFVRSSWNNLSFEQCKPNLTTRSKQENLQFSSKWVHWALVNSWCFQRKITHIAIMKGLFMLALMVLHVTQAWGYGRQGSPVHSASCG